MSSLTCSTKKCITSDLATVKRVWLQCVLARLCNGVACLCLRRVTLGKLMIGRQTDRPRVQHLLHTARMILRGTTPPNLEEKNARVDPQPRIKAAPTHKSRAQPHVPRASKHNKLTRSMCHARISRTLCITTPIGRLALVNIKTSRQLLPVAPFLPNTTSSKLLLAGLYVICKEVGWGGRWW